MIDTENIYPVTIFFFFKRTKQFETDKGNEREGEFYNG